jgi:hypothetical protein
MARASLRNFLCLPGRRKADPDGKMNFALRKLSEKEEKCTFQGQK